MIKKSSRKPISRVENDKIPFKYFRLSEGGIPYQVLKWGRTKKELVVQKLMEDKENIGSSIGTGTPFYLEYPCERMGFVVIK